MNKKLVYHNDKLFLVGIFSVFIAMAAILFGCINPLDRVDLKDNTEETKPLDVIKAFGGATFNILANNQLGLTFNGQNSGVRISLAELFRTYPTIPGSLQYITINGMNINEAFQIAPVDQWYMDNYDSAPSAEGQLNLHKKVYNFPFGYDTGVSGNLTVWFDNTVSQYLDYQNFSADLAITALPGGVILNGNILQITFPGGGAGMDLGLTRKIAGVKTYPASTATVGLVGLSRTNFSPATNLVVTYYDATYAQEMQKLPGLRDPNILRIHGLRRNIASISGNSYENLAALLPSALNLQHSANIPTNAVTANESANQVTITQFFANQNNFIRINHYDTTTGSNTAVPIDVAGGSLNFTHNVAGALQQQIMVKLTDTSNNSLKYWDITGGSISLANMYDVISVDPTASVVKGANNFDAHLILPNSTSTTFHLKEGNYSINPATDTISFTINENDAQDLNTILLNEPVIIEVEDDTGVTYQKTAAALYDLVPVASRPISPNTYTFSFNLNDPALVGVIGGTGHKLKSIKFSNLSAGAVNFNISNFSVNAANIQLFYNTVAFNPLSVSRIEFDYAGNQNINNVIFRNVQTTGSTPAAFNIYQWGNLLDTANMEAIRVSTNTAQSLLLSFDNGSGVVTPLAYGTAFSQNVGLEIRQTATTAGPLYYVIDFNTGTGYLFRPRS